MLHNIMYSYYQCNYHTSASFFMGFFSSGLSSTGRPTSPSKHTLSYLTNTLYIHVLMMYRYMSSMILNIHNTK